MAETLIATKALYNALVTGEQLIASKALYNNYFFVSPPPEEGVGVGPTTLTYLSKLYEIRVYIGGGVNWNYTRFGLKDALWSESNPWVTVPIPGGKPRRAHMSERVVEGGTLRCVDTKAVSDLFRNMDVRSEAGTQPLIGSPSYAATKVEFIYKGTEVDVASGNESEKTITYSFVNFRVEVPKSSIDEKGNHIWEIGFNADNVTEID
jgi:hypothetical protein